MSTRVVGFLILLEFSSDDEYTVAVASCCQLLAAAGPLEPLGRPVLCKNHKDLETVADLDRKRIMSATAHCFR